MFKNSSRKLRIMVKTVFWIITIPLAILMMIFIGKQLLNIIGALRPGVSIVVGAVKQQINIIELAKVDFLSFLLDGLRIAGGCFLLFFISVLLNCGPAVILLAVYALGFFLIFFSIWAYTLTILGVAQSLDGKHEWCGLFAYNLPGKLKKSAVAIFIIGWTFCVLASAGCFAVFGLNFVDGAFVGINTGVLFICLLSIALTFFGNWFVSLLIYTIAQSAKQTSDRVYAEYLGKRKTEQENRVSAQTQNTEAQLLNK